MKCAVIGGGPAGLRAAEVAAAGGAQVTLYEAKPSPGRKLLVAGRGGLNLSKEEPAASFAARYSSGPWAELLTAFDHAALRAWAAEHQVELFTASTGRIYPRGLKSAPLLRRWLAALRERGVRLAVRHRWVDLRPGVPLGFTLATPEGEVEETADAVILALGGASWPETGSDGGWTSLLAAQGVCLAPWQPANCGWEAAWTAKFLAVAEGQPLKAVSVRAAGREVKGELLVTRYGLEGGALYQLGPVLRAMEAPAIEIDFKPSLTTAQLLRKMGPITRNLLAEARTRWRLGDAALALLSTLPACGEVAGLAARVKGCPVALLRPRPLAEAISSAGGVPWSELDEGLMLRRLPGVFVAGEMLDWEAPTGGYLLHGCLASGTVAARSALRRGGVEIR